MQLLVIGASSYIGNHIFTHALLNGLDVIGTRFSSQDKQLIQFDMLKNSISEIIGISDSTEKVAVICSADTKIDYCYSHNENAYLKNVTATLNMIDELQQLKFKIIFFSTDSVFRGTKGNYIESDDRFPVNEYGKMKKIVEDYIMDNIRYYCIVRIGKTIGDNRKTVDLFYDWYEKVRKNEIIYCIKNNYFTLVNIADVVECIFLIINNNMKGIYHIVGDEKFSRGKLCEYFCNSIQMSPQIEEVVSLNLLDNRPLDTSMSNKKFVTETGYQFRKVEDLIKNLYMEK